EVPTLRERRADIPALASQFLEEFARRHQRPVPVMTAEALDLLCGHSWPGNVRDLRNCMERLVVLDHHGEIRPEDLPRELRLPAAFRPANRGAASHAEREALLHALLECRGNRTAAAARHGRSRRHFY